MTLDEMLVSTQPYLNPTDVTAILRCDPQCIRDQAKRAPEKIGFPLVILGNRVRIPRIPFLNTLVICKPLLISHMRR